MSGWRLLCLSPKLIIQEVEESEDGKSPKEQVQVVPSIYSLFCMVHHLNQNRVQEIRYPNPNGQ